MYSSRPVASPSGGVASSVTGRTRVDFALDRARDPQSRLQTGTIRSSSCPVGSVDGYRGTSLMKTHPPRTLP